MIRKLAAIFLLTLTLGLIVSCSKAKDEVKGKVDASMSDGDGNIYTSVKIGTQEWLVENLKTTRLNDGTEIANITNQGSWSSANAASYCWYDNNEADNKSLYGALYNLNAVKTGKLCPVGWHVPGSNDWNALSSFLGGDFASGGALKEAGLSHWTSKNEDATNSSGFTGLPGGGRGIEGNFDGKGFSASWWCKNTSSDTYGTTFGLYYSTPDLYNNVMYGTLGASVRCVKD